MSRLFLGLPVVLAFTPASAMAQASPSPFTSAVRYDAAQRVVGTISPDPDGTGPLHYLATRNTYDLGGRLTRVETGELATWQPENIDPVDWANVTTFTIFNQVDISYDGLNHKIAERVSASGVTYKVTQYSYDFRERLDCTAVRMNPATFGSLPASACTLGTEGSNGPDRITKNIYDEAGRLTQIRKAVGTTLEQAYATYGYTEDNKQEYVVDANGNKSRFVYDGYNRQIQWQFPSAAKPAAFNPSTQVSALASSGAINTNDYEAYSYDLNSNRTSLKKRDGRTFTYTYDALNRVTSKIVPDACVSGYACTNVPASMTRDVYYSYDLRGLQTAARFDSTSGADAVLSDYDGFGRQTSSTTAMGGTSRTLSFLYDADGNRVRVTHPDSYYLTYDYDGLDRAIAVKEGGVATVVTMAWDAAGRRSSEARGGVGVVTSYGYDAISRLSSLTDDLGGSAYDVTTTFSYNPASQITSRTRSNTAYAFPAYVNASRSYVPNGLNQYAAVAGVSYGYDSNGNLTSDGSIAYTYDAENRLVVTSAGAQLTYDPLGRLYETYKASTGTLRFLYDGDQLSGEYNSGGSLMRRYVHGTGEDDPLLWYEGADFSDRRSLQIDHQGSVVSVADSTGNATGVYAYDEYGIPGSTGYTSRFQYTGQAWIPEAGMYYYKARMYSPTLGRFMQTDPIGYDDQNNLYSYVANDPVNGRDPMGTEGQDLWGWAEQQWDDFKDNVRRLPKDLADLPAHIAEGTTGLPPTLGGSGSTLTTGLSQAARGLGAIALRNAPTISNLVNSGFSKVAIDGANFISKDYKVGNMLVSFAGKVGISGKSLSLSELQIFASGKSGANSLGASGLGKLQSMIFSDLKAAGFNKVTISGTRISGANPGRAVTVVKELQ